uniref:Putative rhs-related protein n=1 Tax=Ralstonia solanacearum TaxID=305 RepID=A0A0S4TYR7_RALSL|nr:putative rhs-related protein [Ralstonia solanacearum]
MYKRQTQYAYDTVGNLTQITDPRGLVTTFSYDALGRRTQVQGPPATPGGGAPVTLFNYDGQDRVRQITDPRSLVTTYTVDGLGNTTRQQSPDTGTTSAIYDVAGNLTRRTDARGKITRYRYDAVNRMTHAVFASGTPIAFTYDGGKHPEPNDIGHLTHISDESGQTRWRFNGFGNVVRKTQSTTANGETKKQVVAYAYGTSGSSTGHVTSMTYPSGGVVAYSYDVGGRIAGLTLTTAKGSVALLSNIQYQPFGKPTGWTWGNGTAYTRSFDLSGRLTQFPLGATTGTGATPNGLSRTVNYDAASRITAYTHTDTSGSTGSSTATAANQTFGYDDQDRLTSYLPANSSQSYSYDANGNRTGQTIGGSSYTQTIDPKSNRQTASTGPAATKNSYDAAGNLTSDGTTTYSYSDRGRLASVTKSGTTTSYLYNGLGQRVVKSGSNVPTGATRYVYDEADHLIGEYDQSGNAIQETVYLGDTPIATVKNGTPYYIYADQIDTPRVITDTNNLMVWRWDQADPFGATLPDENPTSLGAFTYNLRFPGQVYDAETGKHYNANRDYDPAGGRYIQSDPIGLNGGQWSTYAYVGGQPTRYTDASGLCPLCGLVVVLIDLGLTANEIATADVPLGRGGGATAVARSTTNAAKTVGQIGREGEAAVRASCDIGTKAKLTINGRTRIPDGLIPEVSLSEVKNVSRQSATQQVRDYLEYAEENGLRLDLYTRTDTRLSGPLQQMINDGRINLLPILPKR